MLYGSTESNPERKNCEAPHRRNRADPDPWRVVRHERSRDVPRALESEDRACEQDEDSEHDEDDPHGNRTRERPIRLVPKRVAYAAIFANFCARSGLIIRRSSRGLPAPARCDIGPRSRTAARDKRGTEAGHDRRFGFGASTPQRNKSPYPCRAPSDRGRKPP